MNTISQPVLSRRDTRYSDELYHHGILGQKWGIRKYQNPDGTLTEEGRQRYAKNIARGNMLIAKGRTKGGAIGRGIGRQAVNTFLKAPLIGGGVAGGVAAVGGALRVGGITKAANNPFGVISGARMIAKGQKILKDAEKIGLMSAGVSYALSTASNISRTIRDYRDISIAEIAARK